MYTYRAKLSQSNSQPIYDGDTLRLVADLGFGILAELGPCRLFGIDAPEMRGEESDLGVLARDWLREMIPTETWFTIKTYKDRKGKYGRYLAWIELDDGTIINDAIVGAGHAVYRTY